METMEMKIPQYIVRLYDEGKNVFFSYFQRLFILHPNFSGNFIISYRFVRHVYSR